MTGPKLNEKSFVAGERSGTKATARYVRPSAFKARVVLDLIRGLDVKTADEVLQFTDRHIARDIRKVLASAVANAVNNDSQDADELYVVACFADEGPTLKRFRPRARGRATRINKRSCHITIIVARMSDDRIAILTARQERAGGSVGRGRPQSSAASRRARVERSRQQASVAEEAIDAIDADEGPTLKRFRPRARGRATRINKRSCHITIIVARTSDDRIAVLTARQERAGGSVGRGRPQSSAASRRARVERSRQQAAATDTTDTTDEVVDAEIIDETTDDTVDTTADDAVESANTESAEALEADATEGDATAEADVAEEATESDDSDDVKEDETDNVKTAAEGSASDEAEPAEENQRSDEKGKS
jgi:ribosomal protein L22